MEINIGTRRPGVLERHLAPWQSGLFETWQISLPGWACTEILLSSGLKLESI